MPSTNQSIVLNASVDDVWTRFSDFHDLSWAPNVIASVEKVGEVDGGSVGARRILNGVFHETLVEIDDDAHFLRYSIDDGPSPVSRDEVSNYFGVVKLSSAEGGSETLVEWTSSWDSNSEDAVAFCHGIYIAFLDELVHSFKK